MTCPPSPTERGSATLAIDASTVDQKRVQREALRDATFLWYEDQMEQCRCGAWVPFEELEILIGTPPLCRNCRWDYKWSLFEALREAQTWPLGLA